MGDAAGGRGATERSVVALAQELIRVPSPNPPWDERAVAELLTNRLREAAIDAEVLGVEDPGSAHANVFARIPGTGHRPPFVFCGHLDTVPPGERAWSRDPYTPAITGDMLYGLGATDMKGAIAAMCIAAMRLAAEARQGRPLAGDLLLAFTSGEETGSRGARALAQSGALNGSSGVVIGEPTGNDLGIAEKGGIWLDVSISGRTAHASLPHLGANAVAGLAEVLMLLEASMLPDVYMGTLSAAQSVLRAALVRPAHLLLGAPTLVPARMNGGVATNVVPDHATVVLDIRTLPNQRGADVLAAVAAVADEVAARRGLRSEVVSRGERVPLSTAEDHPLVTACATAIEEVTGRAPRRCGLTGATDATELVPALGLPFVICGPGEMAQAHQPDEYVAIPALEASVEIYYRLARAMLG